MRIYLDSCIVIDYNLKTPDALHLAAAIIGGCQEFWTQDHRLDHAAAHYLRTTSLQ